jgi:hypothetical protein
MTRTAALPAILLLALAACGQAKQQDGDELLHQEQIAAKQDGKKQAQDIVSASLNDTSAAQISQLEADVEGLKGGGPDKRLDVLEQQVDDQRAQIIALQADVDDLKSSHPGTLGSPVVKPDPKMPPSRAAGAARSPIPAKSAIHPDAVAKP